jgi:cell wall-associated NlpC family hydrolase
MVKQINSPSTATLPPLGLPRVQQTPVDYNQRIDPRVNAYRADIADIALAGRIAAQHYVGPVPAMATVSVTNVHLTPDAQAEVVTQLLFGEGFMILERRDGWCWGSSARDSYVGYIQEAHLGFETALAPTHRLRAAAAHSYEAASIKSAVVKPLYRGSLVHVVGYDGDFARLADGSFVRAQLLSDIDAYDKDWVLLAGDMLETPYLWGGCSRAGIDCSGLVQLSLQACGIGCPRDCDMQHVLGDTVPEDMWKDELERGDLVFFPGHVGIMVDWQLLLHANAFHMKTVIEPLADVVARLQTQHAQPILTVRRLPKLP